MKPLLKKHADKLRFAIVGGGNTILDFGLLFFFVWLGIDKIFANYLSTGIAFLSSFYFNRSFTFRASSPSGKRKQLKQFALFIGITITALWVIQPILITILANLLASTALSSATTLFVAKCVATVGSMIWNYTLYKRFVFTPTEQTRPLDQ